MTLLTSQSFTQPQSPSCVPVLRLRTSLLEDRCICLTSRVAAHAHGLHGRYLSTRAGSGIDRSRVRLETGHCTGRAKRRVAKDAGADWRSRRCSPIRATLARKRSTRVRSRLLTLVWRSGRQADKVAPLRRALRLLERPCMFGRPSGRGFLSRHGSQSRLPCGLPRFCFPFR